MTLLLKMKNNSTLADNSITHNRSLSPNSKKMSKAKLLTFNKIYLKLKAARLCRKSKWKAEMSSTNKIARGNRAKLNYMLTQRGRTSKKTKWTEIKWKMKTPTHDCFLLYYFNILIKTIQDCIFSSCSSLFASSFSIPCKSKKPSGILYCFFSVAALFIVSTKIN